MAGESHCAVIAMGSLLALSIIYVAQASLARPAAAPPKGEIVIQLIRPFYREGFAVSAPAYEVQQLDEFGDDPKVEHDRTSPVLIYEDGHELGPPHNTYADVHDFGAGRFAHWKGMGLVFSSSDNTDPNTNGRAYFAVKPAD